MHRTFIILILLVLMPSSAVYGADTKQERNFIVEGNNLYKQKRFAEAETMYKKALTVSPTSEVARFNLASALIRQSGSADPNSGNTPLSDAIALLSDLEKTAQTAAIVEKAAYDLGNISFNAQQYQQAVEHYKNALRKNPDNDKARENLRL
ncbi:MAG: tetratricopeptide repeat protein, partial [Paramuribaculum sp.]|nr:tetratricopeptide repeat protein [Paramuribaculum sp.]